MALVIVGLLAGGTIMGQNMLHNSEVQDILVQKEEFISSVHTFQDRYKGLPGDLRDATDVWGAEDVDPAACAVLDATSPSTTRATCNGNGNRRIADISDAAETYERHRMWQHLSNAVLIPGTYTGVPGADGVGHVFPGSNAPTTDLPTGGWSLVYLGYFEGDATYFDGGYEHALIVGSESSPGLPLAALVTAEEAWQLDKKADDAKPARGHIMTSYGTITNCHDAADEADLDADYDVAQDGQRCNLIFRNLF